MNTEPRRIDRTRPSRKTFAQLVRGRSLTVIILCALLGFVLIVQVRQQPEDSIATMREDDLVKLLDELGQRNAELSSESRTLQLRLDELQTGARRQEAAEQAAKEQAEARSILAGTVAVHGPGVSLTIVDNEAKMTAQMMVTILEELRNAGAEAIEINSNRLTTSSWFLRKDDTLIVDGNPMASPYVINAIGDTQTLSGALNFPGGVLATIRNAGARSTVTPQEDLEIASVRPSPRLSFATPEEKN
ncbi:MAG: DUF881 domain-containing protein [Bowdeniella nasicola]|nr:DUF881 domain-containing protein [Bowdeniella nasicola]